MIENSLWKVLAFIILSIMLFIVPLYLSLLRQDMVTFQIVEKETVEFSDLIRDLGYITSNMYTEYHNRIHATGLHYDIKLVHHKKQYYPLLDGEDGFFIDYEGCYTEEILNAVFSEESMNHEGGERYYYLAIGDFITIEVKSQGKTKASVIRGMLGVRGQDSPDIFVRSGGMIHSEIY